MRPRHRRLLSAFLLGIIAGSALVGAAVAGQIERITLQRDLFFRVAREQRQTLDQMRIQLEQFQTKPVVESVEVHILDMPEDRPAVSQRLVELLQPLGSVVVGQLVEDINPLLLRNLYDGRIATYNDADYEIQVLSVIVAPVTHFFLRAMPIP